MATGRSTKQSREVRDRARLYRARQDFHQREVRRRRRDNLIAGLGGGVLVVGLLTAQTLYFTAGPGVPVSSTPPPPIIEPVIPPDMSDLPLPVFTPPADPGDEDAPE